MKVHVYHWLSNKARENGIIYFSSCYALRFCLGRFAPCNSLSLPSGAACIVQFSICIPFCMLYVSCLVIYMYIYTQCIGNLSTQITLPSIRYMHTMQLQGINFVVSPCRISEFFLLCCRIIKFTNILYIIRSMLRYFLLH